MRKSINYVGRSLALLRQAQDDNAASAKRSFALLRRAQDDGVVLKKNKRDSRCASTTAIAPLTSDPDKTSA